VPGWSTKQSIGSSLNGAISVGFGI
jgi:hypothetical protein